MKKRAYVTNARKGLTAYIEGEKLIIVATPISERFLIATDAYFVLESMDMIAGGVLRTVRFTAPARWHKDGGHWFIQIPVDRVPLGTYHLLVPFQGALGDDKLPRVFGTIEAVR